MLVADSSLIPQARGVQKLRTSSPHARSCTNAACSTQQPCSAAILIWCSSSSSSRRSPDGCTNSSLLPSDTASTADAPSRIHTAKPPPAIVAPGVSCPPGGSLRRRATPGRTSHSPRPVCETAAGCNAWSRPLVAPAARRNADGAV